MHTTTTRTRRWWVVPAVIASVILLAIAGLLTRPSPTVQPLTLPLQEVTSTVPGVDGPAVILGQSVAVDAVKCSSASHPIPVQGFLEWVEVQPEGFTVQGTHGVNQLPPGCNRHRYLDAPPAAVTARAASADAPTVWKLNGTTQALIAHSLPAYYQSDDFTVVPPGG